MVGPCASCSGDPSVPVGDITTTTLVVDSPERATHAISGPFVLNIMWMLTDFTVENGATRTVPGSHLSGGVPSGEPREVETQIEELLARYWLGRGVRGTERASIDLTNRGLA